MPAEAGSPAGAATGAAERPASDADADPGERAELVLLSTAATRWTPRRALRQVERRLRLLVRERATRGDVGGQAVPTRRAVRLAALAVAAALVVVVGLVVGLGRGSSRAAVATARPPVPSATAGPSRAVSGTTPSAAPKSTLPKGAVAIPGATSSSMLGLPGSAGPGSSPAGSPASSGAASSGPASGPVLGTAQASAILTSLWSSRRDALAAGNLAQLRAVEDGAALQVDEGQLAAGTTPSAPAVGGAQVIVTSGTSYPLAFLAAVGGTTAAGSPPSQVLIVGVHQLAASGSWLIDLLVTVPANQVPTGASPPGAVTVGPSTLGQLAAAWQSWAAAGAAPGGTAGFADGEAYAAMGQQLVEQQQLATLRGLREQVAVQAVQTPGSVFVEGQPGRIVCGDVVETATFTAASGAMVVQPTDQSTWGPQVSPGGYRSVTELATVPVCVASTSAGLQVFGGGQTVFQATAAG